MAPFASLREKWWLNVSGSRDSYWWTEALSPILTLIVIVRWAGWNWPPTDPLVEPSDRADHRRTMFLPGSDDQSWSISTVLLSRSENSELRPRRNLPPATKP